MAVSLYKKKLTLASSLLNFNKILTFQNKASAQISKNYLDKKNLLC